MNHPLERVKVEQHSVGVPCQGTGVVLRRENPLQYFTLQFGSQMCGPNPHVSDREVLQRNPFHSEGGWSSFFGEPIIIMKNEICQGTC